MPVACDQPSFAVLTRLPIRSFPLIGLEPDVAAHAMTAKQLSWSNDWGYAVLSQVGDPDEDAPFGFLCRINGSSDTEAGRCLLAFVSNNFDDDLTKAVAASEGEITSGVYRVRLTIKGQQVSRAHINQEV